MVPQVWNGSGVADGEDESDGTQFGPRVPVRTGGRMPCIGRVALRRTVTTATTAMVTATVTMPQGRSSHQAELSDTGGTVADAGAWDTERVAVPSIAKRHRGYSPVSCRASQLAVRRRDGRRPGRAGWDMGSHNGHEPSSHTPSATQTGRSDPSHPPSGRDG
ncbi:hypothetical protein GCM10007977_108020 [Dactylosporangium sucinum]|uniref:Uncharacterized protein n=1 Tax=Dactylosporangium sucinum TaxID=1424081 RepID=A0A917UF51_9ACTN|nr:hypothetical protein GCM10007977_108020 [Dactylosporangium sucinum]